MEPLWIFIIIFVVISVFIGIVLGLIDQKRAKTFINYLKQNFPDFSKKDPIFLARQTSKRVVNNTALTINEKKKELILIFLNKGKGISHKVFPFESLTAIKSSDKINQGGIIPPTYEYERTMSIEFNDGSKYDFIEKKLSNKEGNDNNAKLVKDAFAPWEEKLSKIIK